MSESRDAAGSYVPDRGPSVFAVSITTLAAASVFVGARMVSRYFIVRSARWDDKIMILAWLIAFFLSFTIALGTAHGLGRYDVDIPEDQRAVLRRCEYVFSILYNPALMATKTSVLIFYLRLFKDTQFVLKYWSWALLMIVNVAGVILTFINIFQCNPVHVAWNPFYRGGMKCIPLLTEFICSSPINIITNLCLLFLPIPILTKMRLPKRQKVAVVFLFSLGIFVTIVDVIRIYFLQSAVSEAPTEVTGSIASTFGGQDDFAWNASLSFMWSAVEVNVGIICACIPTLKPLIVKLLPAILYDPDGTRSSTSKQRDTESAQRAEQPAVNVSAPRPAALPTRTTATDEEGGGQEWSNMEFLTTPDMQLDDTNRSSSFPEDLTRISTAGRSATENAVYFGFVNMAKPKSMLRTSKSESLKYCSIVSILFFLWGLSYGLLNTLNNVVATINGFSTAETLGLTTAYFGGGYFFGPLLVGEWILRRDEHNRSNRHGKNEMENVGGFKVTFIVGLSIYGIGTIIFWPSAVTGSYGGFMVSNFIVGFGLSVLEVAANSFIILCGPAGYGETRLLVAQAVQGTGSVVSGVLANRVYFSSINGTGKESSRTLINVQWTYLAITLLCAGLALFFYYMPLPEVGDKELEDSAKRLPVDPSKKTPFFRLQLRTVSLILAVMVQYLYVAAQESNSIYFRDLLVSIVPGRTDSGEPATQGTTGSSEEPRELALPTQDYLSIGRSVFVVSRFIIAYLTYLSVSHPRMPRPRTLLTACLVLSFVFALLPVVIRPSNADHLAVLLLLFFFAEGPVWPLIFAIGLRGQGRRTKRAAAFITMGGSGGGIVPFIMYGIVTSGGTVRLSYIVIVVIQVLIMSYPLFLEVSRDARAMVDPVRKPLAPSRSWQDDVTMDRIVAQRMSQRADAAIPEKSPLGRRILGKVTGKLSGARTDTSPQPGADHHEGKEESNNNSST